MKIFQLLNAKLSLLCIAVLALVSSIVLISCQNDADVQPRTNDRVTSRSSDIPPTGPGSTVLGRQYSNPYEISNMTAAYNLLTGEQISFLLPNYLYVRFKPSSPAEMAELIEYIENRDLDLDDTPLDYEITYQGEYYEEPGLGNEEFTWFYTAIPANETLPSEIQKEILAEMLIPPYESILTYTAFVLTDNEDLYDAQTDDCAPGDPDWPMCLDDEYEGGGSRIGENPPPRCLNSCPNWPCCLDPQVDCLPEPCDIGPGIPCDPNNLNWPDCLMTPGGTTGSGGSGVSQFTQRCGCEVYNDRRKPGGVFELVDTQLGPEGLRRVKVKVTRGRLGFIWRSTDTNDDGCWRINNTYNRVLRVKIVFRDRISERMLIRSLRGARYWNTFLQPVKSDDYFFDERDEPLNNLCIQIHDSPDNTSKDEEIYIAAITNNGVHEFWEFAQADGIQEVNEKLEILVSAWFQGSADGAAPMWHQAFDSDLIPEFIESFFTSFPLSLFEAGRPDIIIYFGDDHTGQSDDFRNTVYHEMAHARHFFQVGNLYWTVYRRHNIWHRGYGDPGVFVPFWSSPGLVALAEGWGFHTGDLYTDRKYGLNHSNGFPISQNTWLALLERSQFINQFISHGLYNDMQDIPGPPGSEHGSVIDNINGFTQFQCFDGLRNTVGTLDQYRDFIIQNHLNSTSNTEPDFILLMQSYDF